MTQLQLVEENIKEALNGYYTDNEDDDILYGPVNGLCKICGKPIRSSEGYGCCNCGWEFDIFVENENDKSSANFGLTIAEYQDLYKKLSKGVD